MNEPYRLLTVFVCLASLTGLLCWPSSETFASPPASGAGPSAARSSPAAPAGWLERVRKDLAEREYRVTWQDRTALGDLAAAWHAPNRAQGFRTYFVERGIRVVPREGDEPAWEWCLALVGYGRGGVVWPVPEATLSTDKNRVEYARGALTEWYVNEPRGLEQGFELPAPPEEFAASYWAQPRPEGTVSPGRGREVRPRDLIHLDLALEGSLSAKVVAGGQVIDFVTPEGARAIRYTDLVVTDAGGRSLPAWMEGFNRAGLRGVRLVIDAREAVWPVTVDPLATSPDWTAESDQVDAGFGWSVSTAGDVNGDGYADVVVGAPYFDNGQTDEGVAFVYLGSAAGLALSPTWTAESDQNAARFGNSVSGAGDVNGDGYADVIVGAYLYDNGQTDEGGAFVYHGSAAGLALSADWSAESDQAEAWFGISVSTAGDVNGDGYADVIVGAYYYDNGQTDEGRAFVYHGSSSGLSGGPSAGPGDADWSVESDQAGALFGNSVSTAGDVNGDGYADVVVGAYYYDNGQTDEGRAFVYHGSASGLSGGPNAGPGDADWSAESDQAEAWFGISVSRAGDVDGDGYADVIVGAESYDNGQSQEGGAFVYHGSASGLSGGPNAGPGDADWSVESEQSYAYFGNSVSTAGDVNGDGYADVVVGGYLYDNGQADEGRAFVYHGSASGLSGGPNAGPGDADWSAESDQTGARFGNSVSTAGDVDGDGYADVIVGAYLYDNGQTDEGGAFVYHGSAAGLALSAGWSAEGDQDNARFGYSVSTAGDVNGDGYADVIVGSEEYDNGQANEGGAFVYHGSPAGLATSPAWSAEGDQADAHFGWSVSTAGDVNGDGYADVIVGAEEYDNGQANEGRAYVYHGSAAGLALSPGWSAESEQLYAWFGNSVSTAGDVNGDGYADVIVGAFYYDNGQNDEGRAYVYHGSAAGLALSPAWTAESDQADAWFGNSVSTAGDVNGDGYADVIVGAPHHDNGQTDEGSAFVYLGSSAGLALSAGWSAESDWSWVNFGNSVSTAGDVNGDGYADVVVGAPYFDNGQTDEGRAYVYHGSAAGPALSAGWRAEGDQAGAWFGSSVSTAGDVNGDGYADVIVGAYKYDNGQTDEGSAFLFYGNAGAGVSLRPQQRRADDSAPIPPGLRSHTLGSFRLASLGRTPFGRSRVKLEWEVKPRNQFFDGSGTGQSAVWSDTGTGGAALDELVSSLEPGDYHWRVRLLYEPATTPLQTASRWFTVPWNGWEETDLFLGAFIGGVVWEDHDGDGIREIGEPPIASVLVYLLDASLTPIDAVLTALDGSYRFELPDPGGPYAVRVAIPSGYLPTLPDRGTDDTLDSDVDVLTGETPLIGAPYETFDVAGWSAGLRQIGPCTPPDEPIFIYDVRLGPGNETILDFQDFNQPEQVTGYNVYRSSDAGLPHASWPQIASDIVDGDAGTANIQWADTSLDDPPGGVWYYEVAAYNSACDAEGPW